jgi:antibiotic biosynthesis monooxygenase (ABM) superfamily enzyme
MEDGRGETSKPAAAVITQRIDPASERAYEELLQGIHAEVQRFGGFLHREVIKSRRGHQLEYNFVLHFDSEANLNRWECSPERQKWLSRMSSLAAESTPLQVLTGLETWFTLSTDQAIVPPLRYKMAVVTWLAIFPLITLMSWAMGAALADFRLGLPLIAHTFIATALLVPLMTYVVMPRMTRLFAGWLYDR